MLGIVLSRRDFRETDQIISLYSLEKGKKEALARGVKKITSKNSGSLEPFSIVEVEIIPGKEIDRIGSVQTIELFKNIRADFNKMVLAQRAVSLVEQLFSNSEPDAPSFNIFFSWLQNLNQSPSASPVLLDTLVIKLLACLGFAPELNHCGVCGRSYLPLTKGERGWGLPSPALPRVYYFNIAAGGLICPECQEKSLSSEQLLPLTPTTLQALRTIMAADWKPIFSLTLDKKEAGALHKLVYRFGVFHSGKKLKEWHNQDELSTPRTIDRKK